MPIAEGVDFIDGCRVQDETTRIAGERLGFTEFYNAGELYEFCEDGNETAIAVAEMADDVIRPIMFYKVRIVLTQSQIDEIETAYPSRDGGFKKSIEGWVRI